VSRSVLFAAPAAGVAGAIVGSAVGPGWGILAGVLAGLVVGGLAIWWDRQTLDTTIAHLAQWLEEDRPRQMLRVPTGGPSRRLVIALNAIGERLDLQRGQLARERPWRRELVDSLVSPAILFDADGRVAAANRAARDLLGIPGDTGATVMQALGSAVLADAVERARREQALVEVETDIGDRHVQASVAVVGREALVIVIDRTRERRIEELRRDFVVNASHELKTPATAIQTLSEALEIMAERDPSRVPDLVARLREASERLVRLVHDLLNLRRLEDREAVQAQPVDLVELSREVIAELSDRAGRRHVELALSGPDEAWLSGDPDDLRLVVRNLVANGIQYNREGGRVDVRVAEAGEAGWTLEVVDTGIGIPQQDLQRIFERFYRVDVARSRETGGTGLGLSIVRHAVERHGGTVGVESLLGEGTTFRVTLPTTSRG
jgi:signal transduction histidine kinase